MSFRNRFEREDLLNQNSKGFTLTEMIVTMGIILMLSFLLYPAVIKSVKKGEQAQCMCHLKQIGVALAMYANNWNGNLPYAKRHTYSDDPQSIASCLSSYIQNPDAYICKSTEPPFKNQYRLSYVYNVSGDLIDSTNQIGRPSKSSSAADSSNTWVLIDARSPGQPNPHFTYFANVLWLDTHVEAIGP
ncbi:hypothetical protein ES702_03249 [subsurface metagenome]